MNVVAVSAAHTGEQRQSKLTSVKFVNAKYLASIGSLRSPAVKLPAKARYRTLQGQVEYELAPA